jgi:hypothetical protein
MELALAPSHHHQVHDCSAQFPTLDLITNWYSRSSANVFFVIGLYVINIINMWHL